MTGVLEAPPAPAPPPARKVTHEVVTLENLRSVSRGRSLGLGIAVLVLGVVEVVGFGLAARQDIESTVTFSYNTSTAMPGISPAMRSVSFAVGVVCLAGGVALLLRWRRFVLGALAILGGAFLVGWTVTYWFGGITDAELATRVATLSLGVVCVGGGIALIARWRRKALGALAIVVGAFLVVWPVTLWLGINSGGQLRTLTLPVAGMAYVIGGLTLAAGALLVAFRFDRAAYPIFFVAIGVFILVFLVWMARGSNNLTGGNVIVPLSFTNVLWNTFIGSTPLIFGSLAGILCERSGVVNIAIEGQFMFGAMGAVMVANVVGATTAGFVTGTVAAAVIGGLLGLALAYTTLHFGANQIIVGVVIVAFCTAVVQYLMDQVLDVHLWLNQGIGPLPIAIPFLSKIPVIGPSLFDQNYFVYLAIVLVAVVNFMLFRTRWGLRTRSVGEHPKASETVGINVLKTRYVAVVAGGLVAGIGGAVFTIGEHVQMGVGITGGEGFIALAIMIFGRWRPWGAFAAAMLFGFTLSLGSQLNLYAGQIVVPSEMITALPYLVTIAAVAGLVGRVRPPAADGIPYSRE